MSRWLKSVNNLLETLDGTAETVAEGVIRVGGVPSDIDVDDDVDVDVDVDVKDDEGIGNNAHESRNNKIINIKKETTNSMSNSNTIAMAFGQQLMNVALGIQGNDDVDDDDIDDDDIDDDDIDDGASDDDYYEEHHVVDNANNNNDNETAEYDEFTTDDEGEFVEEDTISEEVFTTPSQIQTEMQRRMTQNPSSGDTYQDAWESEDEGFDMTRSTHIRLETLQPQPQPQPQPESNMTLKTLTTIPPPGIDNSNSNSKNVIDEGEALSIEGQQPAESVSELSFSEADAAVGDDHDENGGNDVSVDVDVDVGVGVEVHIDNTIDNNEKNTGKDPSRNVGMDQSSRPVVDRSILIASTPIPLPQHQQHAQYQSSTTTGTTTAAPTFLLNSPKVDQSPRQPRRTVEAAIATKGTLPILLDVSLHQEEIEHRPSGLVDYMEPHIPALTLALTANNNPSTDPVTANDIGIGIDMGIGMGMGIGIGTATGGDVKAAPPRLPKRTQSSSRDNDRLSEHATTTTTTSKQTTTNTTTPAHKIDDIKHQQQHQQQQPASTGIMSLEQAATTKQMVHSLQSLLVKVQKELGAAESKNKKLLQKVNQLEEKLQLSEVEIEAQAKELNRAGKELEQIRSQAKLEQEELMDEHDEELDDIQKEHQSALDNMRQEYEKTVAEWKEQYESEQARRQQEGGDWTNELEEAIQREKDALKRLHEVDTERANVQSKYENLLSQHESLQQELDTERLSIKAANEREREAHNTLDETLVQHSKQILQRQRREAELEQQVLELGGALTLAQQQQQQQQQRQQQQQQWLGASQHQQSGTSANDKSSFAVPHAVTLAELDSLSFKEKWEQTMEELDSMSVQLTIEIQRRETLQREVQDIAQERAEEVSLHQAQQHKFDQKVADFEATIMLLQSNLRTLQQQSVTTMTSIGAETDKNVQLYDSHELEMSKREIRGLSEQLLRHQGLVENAKTEILALKGRLQAATVRAEEAENTLFSQSSSYTVTNSRTSSSSGRAMDMESGGDMGISSNVSTIRRRVKGGNRGRNGVGVPSIRSALNLGSIRGSNPALDQVAITIDAIDAWMVDMGSFLRHEPLARFGFLLYLVTIHAYCTAVVVFHTTEIEHGDFGSLDSNPRHWREHT
jgi:hypothetical protein